jgi:hypothetical protein
MKYQCYRFSFVFTQFSRPFHMQTIFMSPLAIYTTLLPSLLDNLSIISCANILKAYYLKLGNLKNVYINKKFSLATYPS